MTTLAETPAKNAPAPSKRSADADRERVETRRSLLRGVAVAAAIGMVTVPLYSIALESWSVLAVGLMVAAGAFMAGGLFGFLFGIPQSLTGSDDTEGPRRGYRSNTNLEQISDWFTKILVGAGLVQIRTLINETGNLVEWLSPGLGDKPSSSSFALALLVFFAISGFLLVYLATRIMLGPALARADDLVRYVEERIEKVEQTLRDQAQQDVDALGLANRQLDPEPGAPADPDQNTLDESMKSASPLVRAQVFARARDQRRRTTGKTDERSVDRHARTTPVFRALIAADPEQQFHRNHGQLGFALKDREPPEWQSAEAELSEAIRVRDQLGQTGFLLYEFNRAVCRIHLRPDSPDAILADMRAAAQSNWLRRQLLEQDPWKTWLSEHGYSADDLKA